MRKLEARYSVLALTSGIAMCVGFALMFFFAGHLKYPKWFTAINYAIAASFAGVASVYSWRLLTAKGRVVVSIDAAGFTDIRLTPSAIPWSAIKSVSPYILYKQNTSAGVALVFDPDFMRGLSIRPGARLSNWLNLNFGSTVYVDARTLDASSEEISLVAGAYLTKVA